MSETPVQTEITATLPVALYDAETSELPEDDLFAALVGRVVVAMLAGEDESTTTSFYIWQRVAASSSDPSPTVYAAFRGQLVLEPTYTTDELGATVVDATGPVSLKLTIWEADYHELSSKVALCEPTFTFPQTFSYEGMDRTSVETRVAELIERESEWRSSGSDETGALDVARALSDFMDGARTVWVEAGDALGEAAVPSETANEVAAQQAATGFEDDFAAISAITDWETAWNILTLKAVYSEAADDGTITETAVSPYQLFWLLWQASRIDLPDSHPLTAWIENAAFTTSVAPFRLQVVDSAGNARAGLSYTLTIEYDDNGVAAQEVRSGTTTADGYIEEHDVPPGTCTIELGGVESAQLDLTLDV